MANKMINIDGSILEGGGQIIRNALALSVLTGTPIKITKIRAGRNKPGLMEQHLKGVELLRDMCRGKLTGGKFGSTEIEFIPSKIQGGIYKAPVRTAGSISLLLQVSLPCALFANNSVVLNLQGGTNCEMAPQIDYMTEVFKKVLEKFGGTFDFDLITRGYFPKGGGEVSIQVQPICELVPVTLLEQGEMTSIYGWSYVAGALPIQMAHAMANSAVNQLKVFCSVDIERYKESQEVAPVGSCCGIILVAETSTGCILGASALGKRGEQPEEIGRRASIELFNCIQAGACVDDYCADQIIILMALAKGKSKVKVKEITMHTKTAIYVAELLTAAKFNVVNNVIECDGTGLNKV